MARAEGVGLGTRSAYFFLLLACASALAAIDFVRLDDLPSPNAFDAFEATFALVTLLLLDLRVMALYPLPSQVVRAVPIDFPFGGIVPRALLADSQQRVCHTD